MSPRITTSVVLGCVTSMVRHSLTEKNLMETRCRMICVAPEQGSGREGCTRGDRPRSRRVLTPRGLLGWFIVLLLSGCGASSAPSASSSSPAASGQMTAASPTPPSQEPPPSLVDACFAGGALHARSMWLRASDGVRLYGVEAGRGPTAVVLAHEGG